MDSAKQPRHPPFLALSDFSARGKGELIRMERTAFDSERGWFVTGIEVRSGWNNKFNGKGFGSTPNGAKDSAARKVLMLISTKTVDQLLTPPSKEELVGDMGTPCPVPDAGPSRFREVAFKRPKMEETYSSVRPSGIRLSLNEKTEVVKNWTGRKISLLKGTSLQKIDEMKEDAVLLTSDIREEQNLQMDFEIFYDKDDTYIYSLEVFRGGDNGEESNVKQPESLYFRKLGTGFSPQEAQTDATKKFLMAVWTMLNSK